LVSRALVVLEYDIFHVLTLSCVAIFEWSKIKFSSTQKIVLEAMFAFLKKILQLS